MQGLHSSLSGDLSQAGTSAEGAGGQFHSADRSGHGLCSVQPPLSAGLSDGLCGFPRVLGELAGRGRGWRLFAAPSAATDWFPCPSTAGAAAWKSLMLCLWSHIDPCPKSPGQLEPLALLSGQLYPPSPPLGICCGAQLLGVLARPSCLMGLGAMLPSERGSGSHLGRTAKAISGTSQVLLNGLSGQEGSEATICSRKGWGLALVPGWGQTRFQSQQSFPVGAREAALFPVRLPAQTPPPTRPCRWTEPMVETTAWAPQVQCWLNHVVKSS